MFKQDEKSKYLDSSDEEEKKGGYSSYSYSYTSSNRYDKYDKYDEDEKETEPEAPSMEVANVGPFNMADLQAQSLPQLLNTRTNKGLCGL